MKTQEIVKDFMRKMKQSEQIIDLVLFDGDSYCTIISDLREADKGYYFITHNENTGAKYKVTILSEEI